MSENLLPWQQTVLITNGFLFWDLLPRKFPILADPNMEDKTLMIIYMGGNVSAPIENQLFVDLMITYWKSIILNLMITCWWQCVCSFWRSIILDLKRVYIWVAMYLAMHLLRPKINNPSSDDYIFGWQCICPSIENQKSLIRKGFNNKCIVTINCWQPLSRPVWED